MSDEIVIDDRFESNPKFDGLSETQKYMLRWIYANKDWIQYQYSRLIKDSDWKTRAVVRGAFRMLPFDDHEVWKVCGLGVLSTTPDAINTFLEAFGAIIDDLRAVASNDARANTTDVSEKGISAKAEVRGALGNNGANGVGQDRNDNAIIAEHDKELSGSSL